MATPTKSRRIEIRLSEAEHEAEVAAARTLGVTLSEFFRQAARARADEVLAEHSETVLDEQDATRFLEALDHPERFQPHLGWLSEPPSILPR